MKNPGSGILRGKRSSRKQKSGAAYFDVGSTMARVIQDGEVVWREPSCLAIHTKSESVIAVGQKAYQMLGKTTQQVEIVFPVQHGVIADREAFEQLLHIITRKLNTSAPFWNLIFGFQGAYGTLSTASPQEVKVLKQALENAGLGKLDRRDQMIAAAAHLNLVDRPGQSYCIIDIGGQISEVAIVSSGEVVSSVRIKLGGIQCTERIQDAILQKSECAVSWHTAEVLKRQLAIVSEDGKYARHKLSIRGKHLLTQLGQTVVVSNEDLAPVCTQFAFDLLATVQQLFAHAATEVVTSSLENGVFLVGGGALLKGLPEFLQKHLQAEVTVGLEPELVVARGLAGIYQ